MRSLYKNIYVLFVIFTYIVWVNSQIFYQNMDKLVVSVWSYIHTENCCTHKITLTINVPVVYMAREVMILIRANPLQGSLKGVGPENLTFLGPEMASSESSALWAQNSRSEIISSR